jgi:hypothetical protein
VTCAPGSSATPGQALAHPDRYVPWPRQAAAHFHTIDGMGWDGDLMGLGETERDEMRWDEMRCVSRSRAAGAPRLGKGWHT